MSRCPDTSIDASVSSAPTAPPLRNPSSAAVGPHLQPCSKPRSPAVAHRNGHIPPQPPEPRPPHRRPVELPLKLRFVHRRQPLQRRIHQLRPRLHLRIRADRRSSGNSTGKHPGRYRTQTPAAPSLPSAPRQSPPCAQSSGMRCTASHPSCRAPPAHPSGRPQCTACRSRTDPAPVPPAPLPLQPAAKSAAPPETQTTPASDGSGRCSSPSSPAPPPSPAPAPPPAPYPHTPAPQTPPQPCPIRRPNPPLQRLQPLLQHLVIIARPPPPFCILACSTTHTAQSTPRPPPPAQSNAPRPPLYPAKQTTADRAHGNGIPTRARSSRPSSSPPLQIPHRPRVPRANPLLKPLRIPRFRRMRKRHQPRLRKPRLPRPAAHLGQPRLSAHTAPSSRLAKSFWSWNRRHPSLRTRISVFNSGRRNRNRTSGAATGNPEAPVSPAFSAYSLGSSILAVHVQV